MMYFQAGGVPLPRPRPAAAPPRPVLPRPAYLNYDWRNTPTVTETEQRALNLLPQINQRDAVGNSREFVQPPEQPRMPVLTTTPPGNYMSPPSTSEVNLSRGGHVLHPGYYQFGGGMPRGGLGLSQMNALSKQAHFGGLNTKAADLPGAHLIHSPVPGRVDRIPMRARPGSFVLPADVVSGLGQGNTYAGAKMWGQALSHSVGPAGVANTMKARSFHAPSMPSFGRAMGRVGGANKGFQRGGMMMPIDNDEYVPIITSGGEMLIDPEIVEAMGRNQGGDADTGKKILINSVMQVRKQVAEHHKRLPRPAS
jgi:hypothetical protein